jgi:hypothetical protein
MSGPILSPTCGAVEPKSGFTCDREPNHAQIDGSPHASCAGVRWDAVAGDVEPLTGDADFEDRREEARVER